MDDNSDYNNETAPTDEADGSYGIGSRSSSKRKKSDDASYTLDNYSDADQSTQNLKTIDGIQLTEQICNIILRMPASPDEPCTDIPSYRELASLVSAIGIRALKNRRKEDMVNAIFARLGDLWPKLYSKAQKIAKNFGSKGEPKSKHKSSRSIALLPGQFNRYRKPYNPRLADLLSELYISPVETWDDILMVSTPEESENLRKVYRGINPLDAIVPNDSFANDSLIISAISGPTKLCEDKMQELSNAVDGIHRMGCAFQGFEIQPIPAIETGPITRSRHKL